ncbi:hypothetical protein JT358_14170 [Micrococcales bacterium 31B]|nr:hypothetical protein [Micrococcales bacterium 31B]
MTAKTGSNTVTVALLCDGGGSAVVALGAASRTVTCDGSLLTVSGVAAEANGDVDNLLVGITSSTSTTGRLGIGLVLPPKSAG